MSQQPTLILQMQRMGDLILSFPLLGYLQIREPQHPLWVVAEPRFFKALLSLAPKATFFPPEAAPRLRDTSFHRIVNLSHRADAAALSGALSCEHRIGPYIHENATYIAGFWQLYRSSIVHNNRHNLFHWGDLNLLDCLTCPTDLPGIYLPLPSRPHSGCVGIFTGASEAQKRPSPEFWGLVAKGLRRKGLKPLFLGGPEDIALGAAAQEHSGIAGSNLCGIFSLADLAQLMRSLDLFICADTGPMHLAAWVGCPVLNLSMGPVNAWETGPASPGQHVLRPTSSCVGCWQCSRPALQCQQDFQPARVVLAAHSLIHAPENLARLHLPRLSLLQTGRDARGLYTLSPVDKRQECAPPQRQILAQFWQEWFVHHAQQGLASPAACPPEAWLPLLHRHALNLGRAISQHLRSGEASLPENFWKNSPPLLRPLSGFLQMTLQNGEYSKQAWDSALSTLSDFAQSMKNLNS